MPSDIMPSDIMSSDIMPSITPSLWRPELPTTAGSLPLPHFPPASKHPDHLLIASSRCVLNVAAEGQPFRRAPLPWSTDSDSGESNPGGAAVGTLG